MGEFQYALDVPRTRVTDEELLEGMRKFAGMVGGRAFSIQEFDAWAERPFGAALVGKRLGWIAALRRIGVSAKSRRFEAEELIAELERVWREIGRPPGIVAMKKRGGPTWAPYKARWGSLRRACELVALHHEGKLSREALLAGEKGEVRPRRTIPLEMRWKVMNRDGFKCVKCGGSPAVQPGVKLEVDHAVPVCKGGGNEEENLRTLCFECNRGKKGE